MVDVRVHDITWGMCVPCIMHGIAWVLLKGGMEWKTESKIE